MSRQRVEELIEEFRHDVGSIGKARRLSFQGVEDRDVYNPATPIEGEATRLLPARVESRDSELSRVIFFREVGPGEYRQAGAETPTFELQDPFWTCLYGELVFGGVAVFPKKGKQGGLAWKTHLFRDHGRGIGKLESFCKGPLGMKDMRLCEGPNGSVVLLTRPQGERGGRGKIGFALIDSLDRLDEEAIGKAEILRQLVDKQWCGSNQAFNLGDGRIGVLGHVARYSKDGARHYYPASFVLDAKSGKAGPWKILMERALLPPSPAKRPDLADVLFPGGLVRMPHGKAELYLGVSDAASMVCEIADPFIDEALN
jgi:hypothetical protein